MHGLDECVLILALMASRGIGARVSLARGSDPFGGVKEWRSRDYEEEVERIHEELRKLTESA